MGDASASAIVTQLREQDISLPSDTMRIRECLVWTEKSQTLRDCLEQNCTQDALKTLAADTKSMMEGKCCVQYVQVSSEYHDTSGEYHDIPNVSNVLVESKSF